MLCYHATRIFTVCTYHSVISNIYHSTPPCINARCILALCFYKRTFTNFDLSICIIASHGISSLTDCGN